MGRLAAAALLACAVVLPFAIPYFQVQQELGFQRSLADSEPFSAALSLYAQTPPNNVLYGKWLAPSDPGGHRRVPPGRAFPRGLCALPGGAGRRPRSATLAGIRSSTPCWH